MAKKPINTGACRAREKERLPWPPYGRDLMPLPAPNRCLFIFVGDFSWNAARLNLHVGYRVVLPPGDDPGLYDWRIIRGSDAFIMGFGEPEPLAVIAKLGGLLHMAGAMLVVYAHELGPAMRIDPPARIAA